MRPFREVQSPKQSNESFETIPYHCGESCSSTAKFRKGVEPRLREGREGALCIKTTFLLFF